MRNSDCEIERKVDSYQSGHVCDVGMGQIQYILPGATMAFYRESKPQSRQKFSVPRFPVFKSFAIEGWI